MYALAALFAGISIVIARTINANLAQKIGLIQGTFFNYITGLVGSIILLLFSQELVHSNFPAFNPTYLFAYLGGLVGVIVVMLSSYMTPKISAFYMTLFIFVGQLFTGLWIDALTLSEVSVGKIIGGVLVLTGLIYNLLLDQKQVAKE